MTKRPETPSSDQLFAQASQALQAGQVAAAEAACRALLRDAPAHVGGLLLLGAIATQAGRAAEARTLIAKAVAQRPDFAPAHFALGGALRRLGRLEAAAGAYAEAARLAPGLAAAHYNLGNTFSDLGRPEAAAGAYRDAIGAAPDHADAYNNLGAALLALDRPAEALQASRKAAALQPDSAPSQFNLGRALTAAGEREAAVGAYQAALALQPDYADAWLNLGNALFELNRSEAAAAAYRQAAALRPADAEARLNLAEALQTLGETVEALATTREALALDPASARGWLILSQLKAFPPGDPDLAAMERLARKYGDLTAPEAADLAFALGKAWMDAGDGARAFAHFGVGNRLRRAELDYDPQADLDWLASITAAARPELFERLARPGEGVGEAAALPVFILGMPRSGTSLVEQILASHPQIQGAGELADLEAVICAAAGEADVTKAYPGQLFELGPARLRALGDAYLERVRPLAAGKPRLADKMPGNFPFAGLVALALPGARIIHCRRSPADTCVSCYSRKFTRGQGFTYDLADLGRYYRAYEALMAHWRAVLPPDRFLEVDYEAVVDDLEGQARRLIAFCGLSWDAACLRFYETRRPVRTASANQVRQPIYRASVERWRAFEPQLEPLLAALRGEDTPAAPG